MKKVSIIQPIIDAIEETEDSVSKHMNQLIKWAKYCEKAIGSLNSYPMKATTLTVTGSLLTLPDDCYKPYKLFLGDFIDSPNVRYFDKGSTTINVENIDDDEQLGYVWSDLSTQTKSEVKWEEVGDKLSISDEYTDQTMTLVYNYIQTDIEGYWIINESHVEAIKRYLIYMVAKKYMFKNFKSSKMTRNADIMMVKEYERQYSFAIRNARALDTQESPLDTRG